MNGEIGFPKKPRTEDHLLLEYVKRFPCMACGRTGTEYMPTDPSHVLTRGAGRPDAWWNVVSHCRECHTKWEKNHLGFLEEYPRFWNRLKAMGWELIDCIGKRRLWHPYLEGLAA